MVYLQIIVNKINKKGRDNQVRQLYTTPHLAECDNF